jgi:hypothetical protein
MRSPKDFFAPLALGAPQPLREIPTRPSRMIHFFDPSNAKMATKIPDLAAKADVLVGNLEDAIQASNKVAAREGLVKIAREQDVGAAALWTRVNSLDSPWALDDLITLVTEIGDRLDVIMIPKVEGPADILYVDRVLAQLEARAKLSRPVLVHALLETASGMANVEAIAGASPRMQGISLGPADLAASRRMKTTRVGGGTRDTWYAPTRRSKTSPRAGPPTSRISGTTRSPARSMPACCTASCPTTARSATSATPWAARTSSATPTCSAASARGACTRCRSTSPRRCSPRPRRTSRGRAR